MKIDGNELAILQNDLDREGKKEEALKIKLEFLRQVRESGDHCPCKERAAITQLLRVRDYPPRAPRPFADVPVGYGKRAAGGSQPHNRRHATLPTEDRKAAEGIECGDCSDCPGCGE